MEAKTYIVRTEGAGTYGLGEEILPNITLFKAGNYGLTKEELTAKMKAVGAKTQQG